MAPVLDRVDEIVRTRVDRIGIDCCSEAVEVRHCRHHGFSGSNAAVITFALSTIASARPDSAWLNSHSVMVPLVNDVMTDARVSAW